MIEEPPDPIVVRICPEHMIRIYDREDMLNRMQSDAFRLEIEMKPMKKPWRDHKGQLLVSNENRYFLDKKFPPRHKRSIVLHTHCFRTEHGDIGASGKLEPKEMLIGDNEYRQLEFVNPVCALCAGGDMIPRSERFFSSKYKPGVR